MGSSEAARDLRRHGFSFVGPTTAYAFMQAMGLVNDHPRDGGTFCVSAVPDMRVHR